MKSRGMRWSGHVERVGKKRNADMVLVEKPEGKGPSGDLGINGKLLNFMLKKYDWRACTGFIWLRTGISDGMMQILQ
jgi:hypothetical protein